MPPLPLWWPLDDEGGEWAMASMEPRSPEDGPPSPLSSRLSLKKLKGQGQWESKASWAIV